VPADICAAAIRYISSRAAPYGHAHHLARPAQHAAGVSLVIFPAYTRSRTEQGPVIPLSLLAGPAEPACGPVSRSPRRLIAL